MSRMTGLAVLLSVAGLCAASAPAVEFSEAGFWKSAGSPRRVTRLNLGWEFSRDAFKTVKGVVLPHSIDEGEIGFNASGGVNRQERGWYRRTVVCEKRSAHQFLHFEAVMGKCQVFVNGTKAAEHFGGYLPIHVEVTDLLKEGANELVVIADNTDDPSYPPGKPQRLLDFAYFGGIYRDAWLVETGVAYVTDSDRGGVYVRSRLEADGSWTVTADATVAGAPDEVVYFYDGQRVPRVFKPAAPALWTPETPNLHRLTVSVRKAGTETDRVDVRFGIRDIRLDATGLTLNGRPYGKKLVGVNRHQDYVFIGNALSNSLHWRDAKKYRDAGFTCIRNAHYPQDPAFMDACDELGLFVIETTPGWQFWNDAEAKFAARVYDDIGKMVRRDRSRPSVLMWEPILNETRYPADFAHRARALVRANAETANACACDVSSEGADEYDVIYSRTDVPEKVREGVARFTREWGDFVDDWSAQNSSSRIPLEWGEGAMQVQARHYLAERRWTSLEKLKASEPRHFGGCVWHGADHARAYHPDNFFGGVLSYDRRKKYSYYAFQAALTEKPCVFVAHELNAPSPAEIDVYSNCAYTATWLGRPFVPGVTRYSFAEQQELLYFDRPDDVRFVIRYPDGRTETKYPAGRYDRIDVALDTEGLEPVPDGCDLVACTATLVDARGTPKRYMREKVRFSVEGPADIVGENPQETRWGAATVLLRMRAADGSAPVKVRAALDGRRAKLGGTSEGLAEVFRDQRDFGHR